MLNRTVVNNALLDPLQGFDTDVFVLDQATGSQILVGRFTGFQWTVRNATEPYMEFNQRIPRLLDGEFQFGWVLERGLIDTQVMENIFGFYHLGREMRPDRSPRLQITVELNAPALAQQQGDKNARNYAQGGALDTGESLYQGNGSSSTSDNSTTTRNAQGRYHLQNCKVDSVTMGAMAGRQVVATRFEGLAEGFFYEKLDSNTANAAGGAQPTISGTDGRSDQGPGNISDTRSLSIPTRSIASWNDFFTPKRP
jgi:hypothetical protein